MSISRRGFLGAMLGAAMAPAIVKSENLMKIFVPPKPKILVGRGMTSSIAYFDESGFFDSVNEPGYAKAYNQEAMLQNSFGETFWPTVVIDPDLAGIQLSKNYQFSPGGILTRSA